MLMMDRKNQRGISLIEMMVGLTVGMIVVAGAITLTVNQLAEHRRLMLETQIQQDLRAAADLVLRDTRRAGYWVSSINGVWTPGSAASMATLNPYTQVSAGDSPGAESFEYSYSTTAGGVAVAGNEQFGFRLASNELQFKLGQNNWQPLTDRGVMKVTSFRPQLEEEDVFLSDFCTKPCDPGVTASCPRQTMRVLTVSITGEAAHDSRVSRTVDVRARLRNDAISGACPA